MVSLENFFESLSHSELKDAEIKSSAVFRLLQQLASSALDEKVPDDANIEVK